MNIWIASAFGLGLLSSLHCVGMCGPLTLAIPTIGSEGKGLRNFFLYHLGRIFTYSLLGLLFGALGESIKLQSTQRTLSIISGAIILLIWLLPKKYNSHKLNPVYYINRYVISAFTHKLKQSGLFNYAFLGMLNGLLPCGVVYLAAFSAVALGNPVYSSTFMFVFGLATIPALFSLIVLKTNLSLVPVINKINVNKIIPYLSMLVAVLLILRGLNLGIPYVSPKIETSMSVADCSKACCYKK